MVVENQKRWVARQWGNWTGRGVTLNAVGMLRELEKNGRSSVVTNKKGLTLQWATSACIVYVVGIRQLHLYANIYAATRIILND